jgi:tRNA threonylcarbamoyladenosine biosynthesis protein TsaE
MGTLMTALLYTADDESATDALGAALADVLPAGAVVGLCGPLGAGKTRLVQAIAAAAGVDRRDVLSPTFVLLHEYRGRRSIYHFDAYRVRDAAEFESLGPEEYFEGDGLSLIEWADRVAVCLPKDRIEIRIEPVGPNARRFEITAIGPRCAAAIEQLRRDYSHLAATWPPDSRICQGKPAGE